MNRPNWGVRSLAIVVGGAAAIAALSLPADAGSSYSGTVRLSSGTLLARSGASTATTRLATFSKNAKITIACQIDGQRISGKLRTTTRWDRLTNGRYVSDAYVEHAATIPMCGGQSNPTTSNPTGGGSAGGSTGGSSGGGSAGAGGSRDWAQPVSVKVVQGFRTSARPTHDGEDMMARRGTAIAAIADGTVVTAVCNINGKSYRPGDPNTSACDVDGSSTVTTGCGWYVEVRHTGDIVSRYCHLGTQPSVDQNQKVSKGQIIGYVGSSGHSSGPHLHFEIHNAYPAKSANAIDPIGFMRSVGAPID